MCLIVVSSISSEKSEISNKVPSCKIESDYVLVLSIRTLKLINEMFIVFSENFSIFDFISTKALSEV